MIGASGIRALGRLGSNNGAASQSVLRFCRAYASEAPLFTADATSTGGRDGEVRSADGNFSHHLALPKQLGGKTTPESTNPEQMLAAGFSACFLSALGVTAKQDKLSVPNDTTVKGLVSLFQTDGTYKLGVELQIKLPGLSDEEADKLITAADKVCPYSNAMRGNVDIKYTQL
ncbi:hypothetical protein WJX73_009087 [Symbiochloris irregularis]|uniref:Organic hydroperoxide resistance protein n=1 Tax=Symbiochloris irregularis TaxID=706552 RepID=A0AAW1NUH7_9CHLO